MAEGALARLRAMASQEEGLSCVVADALGRYGALDARIRPQWPGAALVGTAVTARTHGSDLSAVFAAIERAGPGDVIVASGPGGGAVAFWGENASLLAQRAGVVGTVLDAPCRDVAAHARLRYPLFAAGAAAAGGVFGDRGAVQVPVAVGGVVAAPGDVVVADENGVVVVPAGDLGDVVAMLPTLLERERAVQADIAAGLGLSRRRP